MTTVPTREQIEALTDIPSIELLRDDIEVTCEKIKVDLEFRPGTEDWAAEARAALVIHQIGLKRLNARLLYLTRNTRDTAVQDAQNQAALISQRNRILQHQEALLKFAKSTAWLRAFHTVAREAIPTTLYDNICTLASDRSTFETLELIKDTAP